MVSSRYLLRQFRIDVLGRRKSDSFLRMTLFKRRLVNLPESLSFFLNHPSFVEGDFYLDCSYHPVLATEMEVVGASILGPWDINLAGISLLDGSQPRSCSVKYCAPARLTATQALEIVGLHLCAERGLTEVSPISRRDLAYEHLKHLATTHEELKVLIR